MNEQTNIQPLGSYVLCRVLEPTGKTTAAGLFIPDTAHARPNQAVVLEVGPGRWLGNARVPSQLKRGDRVVFDPYKIARVLAEGAMAEAQGTPLANHGDRFVIDEAHIFGVIEDKAPGAVEVNTAIDTLQAALDAQSEAVDDAPTSSYAHEMRASLEILREAFASAFDKGERA